MSHGKRLATTSAARANRYTSPPLAFRVCPSDFFVSRYVSLPLCTLQTVFIESKVCHQKRVDDSEVQEAA